MLLSTHKLLYTDLPARSCSDPIMTVNILNPQPKKPAKKGYEKNRLAAEQKAQILSKTNQKKAQAYLDKFNNWADERVGVDKELAEELRQYHVPQTVDEARKRGGISAAEIILAVEELNDCVLGEKARRWVVANFIAQDHFRSRADMGMAYCPEVAEYILERVIDGIPLRKICEDRNMPGTSVFLRWVVEDKDLRERYALAQQMRAMVWADETIHIADTPCMSMTIVDKADGTKEIVMADNVQRSRVKIEARKFMLSKILPKQFGDAPPEGAGGEGGSGVVMRGGLPDDLPNPEPEIPDPESGKTPSEMTQDEFRLFCLRIGVDQKIMRDQLDENEQKRQKLLAQSAITGEKAAALLKKDSVVTIIGGVPGGSAGGLPDELPGGSQ